MVSLYSSMTDKLHPTLHTAFSVSASDAALSRWEQVDRASSFLYRHDKKCLKVLMALRAGGSEQLEAQMELFNHME